MKKMTFRLIQIFVVSCLMLGAYQTLFAQDNASRNAVYVRYEPVKDGPQKIRAKDPTGYKTHIDSHYTMVDNSIIDRLKRKSSVAFWYEIFPSDTARHFVVKAKTKRNSFGFTGSYYFYGKMPKHNDLILDSYAADFDDVSCRMTDFSVGLYLAHQLCATARHRLSLELSVGYRQTKQTFEAGRYSTVYDALDPDGAAYVRRVDVSNYNESQLWRTISVPIGLRYDWFVLKFMSVFVGGGLQNDFTFQQISNTSGDIYCSGQYGDEYFNVVIDQNGYYDFGSFPNNQFKPEEMEGTRYSMYGYGTAGLQFFLGKTISLEVAGLYHYMLYTDLIKPAGADFRLVSSAYKHQSMMSAFSPFMFHRWGINAKLKFSF
ncbi:MAG: hypothetical protein K5846_05220 [Bacteroidales bacterium]|nr:hypothetical protein [Bacteroidales bacterium]